ncbi:MAG: hypothetical protein RLZ05_1549, partial [Bacteroidota bacterium]|jgi:hypothetical protein
LFKIKMDLIHSGAKVKLKQRRGQDVGFKLIFPILA